MSGISSESALSRFLSDQESNENKSNDQRNDRGGFRGRTKGSHNLPEIIDTGGHSICAARKVGLSAGIRGSAELTGVLKVWFFLSKLNSCPATTSSPEFFSGPVTACTGRKSTRRTKSWSYGFGASGATASWNAPAAAASSPMPMTAMNERCGICLGASSGRRCTSKCIG